MGDVPSTPIVFLGPPASGKGTQARRLAELRDHAYLSTGGLLRRALREKSELGEEARPYLDRGEYVPDGIMVPMVLEWVSGKQGKWILDGFPRTLAQAKALDDALGGAGKSLPIAIALEVPDAELQRRVKFRVECEVCHWTTMDIGGGKCLKCGGNLAVRKDDSVEHFLSRLTEFREWVLPTIRYYRDLSRLSIVDGTFAPDVVHTNIVGLSDALEASN